MFQRLPSGGAALPIVTEFSAQLVAVRSIESGGNGQQRKMS
jgi:hypothetical protein